MSPIASVINRETKYRWDQVTIAYRHPGDEGEVGRITHWPLLEPSNEDAKPPLRNDEPRHYRPYHAGLPPQSKQETPAQFG